MENQIKMEDLSFLISVLVIVTMYFFALIISKILKKPDANVKRAIKLERDRDLMLKCADYDEVTNVFKEHKIEIADMLTDGFRDSCLQRAKEYDEQLTQLFKKDGQLRQKVIAHKNAMQIKPTHS
jgi:hypothetical protein